VLGDKKVIPTMTKMFGFEVSANSRESSKAFGISMPFRRSTSNEKPAATQPMTLSQIKLNVELCIQDIQNASADRLRYKIRGAREVRELWMLRSDIHQLIAKERDQQDAARAINALLPCFAGWMPSSQMVKI
jgi:hypothetical protein